MQTMLVLHCIISCSLLLYFSGSFCLLNAICGSHAQIDITCQCHFTKSLNSFRPGSGDDLVKM